MDPKQFATLLGNVKAPASPPSGNGQQPGVELDPEALRGLAESAGLTPPADTPPAQAPDPNTRPDGTSFDQPPAQEPGLGDPSSTDALAGGALKGVFETKDFLFGDTPPDQQSEFRQNVEKTVDARSSQSLVDGFASGIGQFASGMIGLGKVKWAAEALPWVERGFATLEAGRKGKVALETTKAAIVGATAFDPKQERISNLIQDTPLANPINKWLAADPSDSAAEGRMKAALESIGLDATILGTFMFATKAFKALRAGDQAKASKLATEFQEEVNANAQSADARMVQGGVPEALPGGPASEVAGQSQAGAAVDGVPAEGGRRAVGSGELGASPEAAPEAIPQAQPNVAPVAPEGAAAPAPQSIGGQADVLPNVEAGPRLGGEAGGAGGSLPESQPKGVPEGGGAETVPQITSTPTAAAQQSDAKLTSPKPGIKFGDEDTAALVDAMDKDAFATAHFGGWYQAVEGGHTFGKGEGIPYVKLNADQDVDDFIARVVDAAQDRLDKMKGGAVLSDKRVQQLVDQRVALFNDDPALLLGAIQQAGKDATHAVAEMEAGYLVANRMFQDTYALAARIRMGDYVAFGGRDAALEELKKRLSLAASVYGSARSITAASGRAVRRMRGEFKIDPDMVAKLKELDGDKLTELLVNTEGDPKKLAKLANPSLLTKITDFGQFLLINNLVSGPKTQLINMLTNAYMVGARPMERIIGAVPKAIAGNPTSRTILKEATKQYVYLGTALADSFSLAAKAFVLNDSVLSPHRSELWHGAPSAGVNAALESRPWSNVGNVLFNSLKVAVGLPTRTLGTVDELVKQTVYRSKVMAAAHVEAVAEGTQSGLTGKGLNAFVKSFVEKKLGAAFDAEGRGIDPNALREANIATFQQELLPGTLGKTISTGVANHPLLRLVLPFVKTPTNVLRYGWKLTPGLNLLQREYRDMLAGRLGAEAQAQAYGQMTMGTLAVGTAAYLSANGKITGGGPSDPKVAAELKATGWQPYAIVHKNEDGSTTFIPYSRFDPIMMPFGIVADLQDAMHAMGEDPEGTTIPDAMGALAVALAKQFTSKTYLTGIGDAIDAISDPDRNMGRLGGQLAANVVPYSAALRQLNPDEHLRDARTVTDKVMATIPGLSEKVPARYDAWGEKVYVRKGLWSNAEDDAVDLEVQRMALETGASVTHINPKPQAGVDLRDITMADGRNAYEVYQQLSSRPILKSTPLKRRVAVLMSTKAYRNAPDGSADTRGTKLWMLSGVVARYRSAALKILKHDPAVQAAFRKEADRVLAERKAKAGESGAPAPKPKLGRIGESFGVDLDALFPPKQ